MKIINLIKSEFIKNYTIKRFLIIIIVLFCASFFLVNYTNRNLDEINKETQRDIDDTLRGSNDSFKRYLNNHSEETITNIKDEYSYVYRINYIKYMENLYGKLKSYGDFKVEIVNEGLLPIIIENFLIDKMRTNPNDEYILNSCKIEEDDNEEKYTLVEKDINRLCKYTLEEREVLKNKNEIRIKDYEYLLKEDKYYLYLKYQLDNKLIKEDEFIDILIDKKVISNSDYIAFNYRQYQKLEENANINIMSKDEYNKIEHKDKAPYDAYYTETNYIKTNAIKFRQILLYSSKYGIKADNHYNMYDGNMNESDMYINTKFKVDQVYHLAGIIIILVAITSGGIISNEHSRGTIKNIITAPVRRWKILLSKFIYLILDVYFIWILGLIIISIIAGIKYGFMDLFTPYLYYNGSKVVQINYYLYLLKELVYCSIPIICLLSIMFSLSALTLNTGLTVGITTVLGVLAPFLWIANLVGLGGRNMMYFIPLYFDLGFILNNSEMYIQILDTDVPVVPKIGIILSIIITIILYIITNLIYNRRDIKN